MEGTTQARFKRKCDVISIRSLVLNYKVKKCKLLLTVVCTENAAPHHPPHPLILSLQVSPTMETTASPLLRSRVSLTPDSQSTSGAMVSTLMCTCLLCFT